MRQLRRVVLEVIVVAILLRRFVFAVNQVSPLRSS
jgi:hypothetical protein